MAVAYEALIELERCRRGAGTFVDCGGRELAVFVPADSEEVVVGDNACPHANGNLSGGELCGRIITCPWHDWRFDLATGVCTESPLARIRIYPSEVRDGMVWVDLGA
ncbi:MAG: Rieske (2Fe-2S) protein [Phycisphaerae bacterium]